ncbi:unnamed protein product [Phaeothamnion confervicola]
MGMALNEEAASGLQWAPVAPPAPTASDSWSLPPPRPGPGPPPPGMQPPLSSLPLPPSLPPQRWPGRGPPPLGMQPPGRGAVSVKSEIVAPQQKLLQGNSTPGMPFQHWEPQSGGGHSGWQQELQPQPSAAFPAAFQGAMSLQRSSSGQRLFHQDGPAASHDGTDRSHRARQVLQPDCRSGDGSGVGIGDSVNGGSSRGGWRGSSDGAASGGGGSYLGSGSAGTEQFQPGSYDPPQRASRMDEDRHLPSEPPWAAAAEVRGGPPPVPVVINPLPLPPPPPQPQQQHPPQEQDQILPNGGSGEPTRARQQGATQRPVGRFVAQQPYSSGPQASNGLGDSLQGDGDGESSSGGSGRAGGMKRPREERVGWGSGSRDWDGDENGGDRGVIKRRRDPRETEGSKSQREPDPGGSGGGSHPASHPGSAGGGGGGNGGRAGDGGRCLNDGRGIDSSRGDGGGRGLNSGQRDGGDRGRNVSRSGNDGRSNGPGKGSGINGPGRGFQGGGGSRGGGRGEHDRGSRYGGANHPLGQGSSSGYGGNGSGAWEGGRGGASGRAGDGGRGWDGGRGGSGRWDGGGRGRRSWVNGRGRGFQRGDRGGRDQQPAGPLGPAVIIPGRALREPPTTPYL